MWRPNSMMSSKQVKEYVELDRADRIWIAYQIRDSHLSDKTKIDMLNKLQNPITDELIRILGDSICKDRYHGDVLVSKIHSLEQVKHV